MNKQKENMEIKNKLEILVFTKPFKINEITKILNLKKEEINELIKKINSELKDRPYEIVIENDEIFFSPKENYYEIIKDFIKPNLNEKEIKILSLIVNNYSYSEIIKKFGKKTKEILEKLEREGWIKIKKENRKYIFHLTPKFKKYFKIKN